LPKNIRNFKEKKDFEIFERKTNANWSKQKIYIPDHLH